MVRPFVDRLRQAALTLLLIVLVPADAAAAQPPAEHFARLPAIDEMVLSPSGKRLAVLSFGPTGRRRLGVLDLDPIGTPRVISEFSDADIRQVHWIGDDRLVYDASPPEYLTRETNSGTFAIDHDGRNARQLIAWRHATDRPGAVASSRILPYGWYLHSVPDDGSKDVFVSKFITDGAGDLRRVSLARLDTVTGRLTNLSTGMPDGARDWLVDAHGDPRLLTTRRDGRTIVHWRKPGSDAWTEVANFDPLSDPGFEPLIVDADARILVLARVNSDVSALYAFDPATRRVEPEPLVRLTGYDLDPVLEVDRRTHRVVGLHSRADRPFSHWFDGKLQQIQKGIDSALPAGRFNRLQCGRCESTRFIVVHSSSDRHPGEYFLFDRSKASLEPIGKARPWIDEAQQGRRSMHRVTARDGLPIPVYVTHPPGAPADEPLPTVVLVHGGPWVRGSDLEWRSEAQFLASRGYRVLEPEFRGSEGYGYRHFRASWKQWGRAMQDDLVDAVQWAVQQRLSDPARVCISGGSYGGYAALMAPIASPGAFKCAASFAGVTDIQLMYDITWSDFSEDARRYGMPRVIGDPEQDRDLLSKVSPLQRVEEIRIPLLVAYGGQDRRVPVDHSRRFLAAARRAGVTVEEISYPSEGHGFTDRANMADYFERLGRFIDKALGGRR